MPTKTKAKSKLDGLMRFRASTALPNRIAAIARRNKRNPSDQARFILEEFADREEKKLKEDKSKASV